MKTKRIALLLACLMMTNGLLACAGETPQEPVSQNSSTVSTGDSSEEQSADAAAEPEPEEGPDIPQENLDGYAFRVLTRDTDHHIKEVYSEELNGEPVNDAVYGRNATVEEKYNVKLKAVEVTESPESVMQEEFRRAVLAQDDSFDVALMHTVYAGSTALEGNAYDWNTLEYVDFSKPWWNSVLPKELEFKGRLYLAVSDYCISAIDYAWAMVYNRKMAENYQIGELYDTVEAGKWTYDVFNGLAQMTSSDLDGNGVMDYNDQFGYTTHWNSATLNWVFAFDVRYIGRDSDDMPILLPESEKMADIVEKIYTLYFTGDNALYMTDAIVSAAGAPDHDTGVANVFKTDRSLFAALRIYVIDQLRDMDSDFGIIPFPKYNEDQAGYYTHVDGHAPLMVLPKTLSNPRSASIVMEALAYESNKTVVPAVYEIVLQSKYARDESSSRMLDLILGGRVYTFGYIYDDYNGMQWTLRELMQNKNSNYASYYKSKSKSAEAQLKKIIKGHESIGNP